MFEFIWEFLRLSFTVYPSVLLVSTGPLIIITGILAIIWFGVMTVYVIYLALVQWARGEPVRWSRPMTESEKILVGGRKDYWYEGWSLADPKNRRRIND